MTSIVRRTCPALPRQNNLQNETSLHEQAPLVPAVSVFVYFSFGLCYTENRKDVGNMGELRKIPGIGPNIEADLEAIGIHSIADLRGKRTKNKVGVIF